MNEQNKTGKKPWVGVLLVSIGAYFLLRNLDLIPSFIPHYLFGWESIFIIVGASMLTSGKRGGIVFLAIGGISLLSEIFYWPHIDLRDWWPVILIAIGVSFILNRRNRELDRRGDGSSDDDYIDEISIFGGSEKNITSQNFKGGNVTAVFGGSDLNLLNARLSNDQNIIDVFCMFGGSTLIVPNDWTIVMDAFVIFGGYADKRALSSHTPQDPDKVLRIKGFVMFGGGEIKSM